MNKITFKQMQEASDKLLEDVEVEPIYLGGVSFIDDGDCPFCGKKLEEVEDDGE